MNRISTQFIIIFGQTIFFLAFMLVFAPSNLRDVLTDTGLGYSFNLSISAAIIFSSLLLSRSLFIAFRKRILSHFAHCIWCALEIIITCAFIAMFISLSSRGDIPYFDALYRNLAMYAPIMVIPYFIIFPIVIIRENAEKKFEEAPEGSIMKFRDSNHLLKFTASDSAVLFIEAQENYLKINYEENDVVKEYVLRASMKSVEQMCTEHNILRCHRSFYVNVKRINILRKDREGIIYIEMNNPGAKQVPVSKTYYDRISSCL